jgi:membrane-bound lytic murein transglycosylase B
MTSGRLIASLATALVLVSGLGYLASQTVLAGPAGVIGQQAYVAAPVPPAARSHSGASRGGDRNDKIWADESWVVATAARTQIPAPALRAYANAQLAEPAGCQVGWTTLAGIGWVESQHGTIGDRGLGLDGRSSRPILGPALDGRGDFAAIPATPETMVWHGDPTWDHAVGPLQFIPSTWETWASDGDADGVADPNDLDDAAYAAARYLCAGGYDVASGEGWADAVFSYNHAQSYVDSVHAAATAYAQRAG